MTKIHSITASSEFKTKITLVILMFVYFSTNMLSQINQLSDELKQKVNELETEANNHLSAGKTSNALNNFNQIAEIYKKNKLYSSSIEYYNKSLVQAKKINSSYKLNSVYFNLISLYKAQANWSEALVCENEKIKLSCLSGNKKTLANDLINAAYSLRKLKKYTEAISKLEEALKISLFEIKNEQLTIKCYKELANNYNQLGNTEKYNEYTNLIKRIEVEKTTNALEDRTINAEYNAQIKEDSLSKTTTKLANISDSLSSVTDSLTKFTELTREQQLEIQLQNAQIANQETELRINKYIIIFLSIIFLITLTAAILWYIQYKKKHEALTIVQLQKEEILQQKEEIQTQSDELEFQRDELYRSNKTKEKLFSVVAHDLKNPIHALIGFSDLLINEKDRLNSEEKEQYLEFIHSSALQIHNLLENLLKWAQSQSSSIQFKPENIDINELININISLFNEIGKKKQIELIAKEKTNQKAFADKNMVNTIIRNLINNALKFTDKNGKISLSAKTIDNFIEISVTDTGIGITDEIKKKILNPEEFFSSAGTMDEPGTGLGLAICKEFLDAHNSSLEIESQAGKGSTFSFKIPVSEL